MNYTKIDTSKNWEINSEINKANFQGKELYELKDLYMLRNTLLIDIDTPIYRIYQIKHLSNDIQNNQTTYRKITSEVWGDPLENPLLNNIYIDKEGTPFSLGLFEHSYAQSWTYEKDENVEHWRTFSRASPSVRIKSTIKKLLQEMMDINDPSFMLTHWAGKVIYLPKNELLQWRDNPDYYGHIEDGQGLNIALCLLRLNTQYSDEKEIRMLYTPPSNTDNEWVNKNIKTIKIDEKVTLSSHPFNWKNAIEEVVFASDVSDKDRDKFIQLLTGKQIHCKIIESTCPDI